MKLDSPTSTISKQSAYRLDIGSIFWQQWQQYRDYLYRCCVKWMGGNLIDAEDALSRAMLKAWDKVQKYTGEIANFKAWLMALTRNLCVDIHRERSRWANRVEDIEIYASVEEQGLVAFKSTPDFEVENSERKIVIHRAIDNLPTRLRETFTLHFYQELSHSDIAQQQDISYQNVCKRISQARKILQEELRGYFIGEEGIDTDESVPPTATKSEIAEMSKGDRVGAYYNTPLQADAGEALLTVAVEEVKIVGGEEAQEVAGDVQQSESVRVAATSFEKLEVKSDDCQYVPYVPQSPKSTKSENINQIEVCVGETVILSEEFEKVQIADPEAEQVATVSPFVVVDVKSKRICKNAFISYQRLCNQPQYIDLFSIMTFTLKFLPVQRWLREIQ